MFLCLSATSTPPPCLRSSSSSVKIHVYCLPTTTSMLQWSSYNMSKPLHSVTLPDVFAILTSPMYSFLILSFRVMPHIHLIVVYYCIQSLVGSHLKINACKKAFIWTKCRAITVLFYPFPDWNWCKQVSQKINSCKVVFF